LGVTKTLKKVQQRYYWLQARDSVKKWCWQCDTCTASLGPGTRNWGQMHEYNIGAPFERMAIDVARPFPQSNQGNRYLRIALDCFTKWPEAYAIPNQETLTVVAALVTSFFGVLQELYSDKGSSFGSRLIQEVLQQLGVSKTCTRSRTAWSSAISKQSRNTYGRLSHHSRGIGIQEYPSSALLTGHPLMTLQA
jgi:transposase InsO family protein